MSDSLKARTLHALFWSVVETLGAQGVQLVIGLVLARLLLPAEFGVIGMLAIFFAVCQAFLDSGFAAALIQKQNPTHVDECSIFYFNIFVGVVAASLMCLVAPWVADLYGKPELAPVLTPLTQFLSLNLVINAFGLVQLTLMAKRIDFKSQAKITVAATLVSGVVGIALAVYGFGVWSLAIQQCCASVMRTALLWVFNPWRPSLVFSLASLRQMFAFGSRIMAARLLYQVFQSMYQAVIGRMYTAADVGYYSRAVWMQEAPTGTLSHVISRVAMPVFSTIQNDNERLKRGMRQAMTGMVLLNFPVMIGIAAVAQPLVLVVLTDVWLPCVPYLELLCIVGMLFPLHLVNLQLLITKGRSDLFFRLSLFKHVLEIVALVATAPFGIEAILWGRIGLSVVFYGVNSYYTARLVGYTVREQLCDIAPYFGTAALMGVAVYALPYAISLNPAAMLVLQVTTGVLLFGLLSNLFRLPAFLEGLATVKRKVFPLWRLVTK